MEETQQEVYMFVYIEYLKLKKFKAERSVKIEIYKFKKNEKASLIKVFDGDSSSIKTLDFVQVKTFIDRTSLALLSYSPCILNSGKSVYMSPFEENIISHSSKNDNVTVGNDTGVSVNETRIVQVYLF